MAVSQQQLAFDEPTCAPDAAVIGSAIVETIERNPGKEAQAVAEWIKQLTAFSRQP